MPPGVVGSSAHSRRLGSDGQNCGRGLSAFSRSSRSLLTPMTDSQPILIVGLPRSGTTWVGEVFSSAHNTRYIFEPDNEGLSPLAWLYKKDIHRFPYLTSKDRSVGYHQLWRTVVSGQTWT